jgi:uncharacterized protein
MSLLLDINPEPSFAPKTSTPGPERLISSNPVYKCWPQDASRSDKVQTGVWEATPGEHHSIKGTMFEFCHIISGVAEIEEQGGETRTFRAATASP